MPPVKHHHIQTENIVACNDRQSGINRDQKRKAERRMKQSKDPFEAAYEESPPNSPIATDDIETPVGHDTVTGLEDDNLGTSINPFNPSTSSTPGTIARASKRKRYDEDEEEENVEVELSKFPTSADPVKTAKMQAILSQFTEDQMSRYESFRRSALQKSNMRRLLVSVTGSQKISLPMTIVVCGIAKMFVGELVETARIVMTERKESGPIRPCHIREAYRRLKLEGKVPRRSVPRLFR
ncbi:TAFII28 domain-containing protein [Cephalotus follicularis]|uniref:TAFII28 domain-containing protein n=1 Tax=Cephalotus follicularis TaxID=3775 RepID=A0A1Q3AY87_CEPFO|nr:TAFII28 domain-containing protein [Cephalotus follicularis]